MVQIKQYKLKQSKCSQNNVQRNKNVSPKQTKL